MAHRAAVELLAYLRQTQYAGHIAAILPIHDHRRSGRHHGFGHANSVHQNFRDHRLKGSLEVGNEGAIGKVIANGAVPQVIKQWIVGRACRLSVHQPEAQKIGIRLLRLLQMGLHLLRHFYGRHLGQLENGRFPVDHPCVHIVIQAGAVLQQ